MIAALDKIELSGPEHVAIKNNLGSVFTARRALQQCKTADAVLRILHVELTGQKRLSYVQRILGRYHKLDKLTEIERLHLWTINRESWDGQGRR